MKKQLREVWLPPVGIFYGMEIDGIVIPVAKYQSHVLQVLDVEPNHWANGLIERAIQKAKEDWEVHQVIKVRDLR